MQVHNNYPEGQTRARGAQQKGMERTGDRVMAGVSEPDAGSAALPMPGHDLSQQLYRARNFPLRDAGETEQQAMACRRAEIAGG